MCVFYHRLEVAAERLRALKTNIYPQSSVIFRWQQKAKFGIDEVYRIMSEFGPVEAIHMQSEFHCYVIFKELPDACKLMQRGVFFHKGFRVTAVWIHANLRQTFFYKEKKALKSRRVEIAKRAKWNMNEYIVGL